MSDPEQGIWIDPTTGEVIEEREGALWIADPPSPENNEWIPEFLAREWSRLDAMIAGQRAEYEALRASLDRQHARKVAVMEAERKHLAFSYERLVEKAVASEIQLSNGKKKSVDYKWGRFGFRAQKDLVEVEDGEAAFAHLEAWSPDMIKVVRTIRKVPLAIACAAGEEIPGVTVTRRPDKFYFRP